MFETRSDATVGEGPSKAVPLPARLQAAGALSPIDANPGGAPPLPRVGDVFLGFRLVGELGRGAFGRVYLAEQGELSDRPVALKVSPDLARESQSLAQLQHTNIVPIHSVHRQGAPTGDDHDIVDGLRDLGQEVARDDDGAATVREGT